MKKFDYVCFLLNYIKTSSGFENFRKRITPETDSADYKEMIKQLEHVKASPSTDLAILAVTSEENFDLLKTFTDLGLDLGEIDIDEEDEYGFTALQWAVASQKFKAVKYLISKGADVNHRSKLGLTPLFQATGRAPDVKIAKILINHGADVMAKTPTGSVPLHGASLQGNNECVKLLLKNGADPRACDDEGTTPCDLAKSEETLHILQEGIAKLKKNYEKSYRKCANCSNPLESLKRCSRCHIALYCSKQCQTTHWKTGGHRDNCELIVLARPCREEIGKYMLTFNHGAGGGKHGPGLNVFASELSRLGAGNEAAKVSNQFIVKVQVPISCNLTGYPADLMVYNKDRSICAYVYEGEMGYENIVKKIKDNGWGGVKGYFMAEKATDIVGCVRIFPGKMVPTQLW